MSVRLDEVGDAVGGFGPSENVVGIVKSVVENLGQTRIDIGNFELDPVVALIERVDGNEL